MINAGSGTTLCLTLSLVRLSPLQGMPSFLLFFPLSIPVVSLGTLTHLSSLYPRHLPGFFTTLSPLELTTLSLVVSHCPSAVFSSPPSIHFQSLSRIHPLFSLLNPFTSCLCRLLSPGLNNPLTTLCLHPHPPSDLFFT